MDRPTICRALRRVRWDASRWVGESVFLRLFDDSRSGWGHVTFDDFSCAGTLDEAATKARVAR